jgi:tRNA(Ile)-lysidine synthase
MVREMNEDAEIPRGPSVDQALVQLFDDRKVALADCILAGGKVWTVRRAPPRRSV